MPKITGQFLIASCEDLMLAKDCVSELKSANFRGSISLRPSEPADLLKGDTLQAYGSYIGGSTGRGILFGGLLGLAAGAVISSAISPESLYLQVVVLSVATSGALGGIAGWRNARSKKTLRQGREQRGRFVLRCDGGPDDIATAFEALQTAPCRNVQIRAGDGDTTGQMTAHSTEATVA